MSGDQNAMSGKTSRRHHRDRGAAAGTDQTGATSDQSAANGSNGNNGGTLPKTGSELPLLALGGLSTFASGLALKLKARKR
ncbi:MAG TPA: LPXTG cell wall anchor domain-containing protein [Terriglobales bacterium]|nr:LPXTG cell wall anchor domain-containing protein [Terriglobales bacterium]